MNYVLAGAAGGLFMASIFVVVVPIALFTLAEDPTPGFRALLDRVPPLALTMGVAVLSYPAWMLVGVLLGLMYGIAEEGSPGGGLGSPNLAFTVVIVVIGAAVAAPLVALLRRVTVAVAALALAFVALFGWGLPYLAG